MQFSLNWKAHLLAHRQKQNTGFAGLFIIPKVSANFIKIEENFDLKSDHSAIIMALSETIIFKKAQVTLNNKSTILFK